MTTTSPYSPAIINITQQTQYYISVKLRRVKKLIINVFLEYSWQYWFKE